MPRATGRSRGLLVALVPVIVLCGVVGLAGAQLPPGGTFADDDGSVHEGDIEALAAAGITRGCNAAGTLYCPIEVVDRAQMAAFLNRALNLSPGDVTPFTDIAGSPFADDIAAVFAAGITRGCNAAGDRYCPDRPVDRGQMAAFLTRGLGLPPGGSTPFTDIGGSPFADDVAAIFGAGITRGTTPTTYDPTGRVTRAQMASFLARGLHLEPIVPPPATDDSGLGPDDLAYLGAFRLPPGPEETWWAWGGAALTFRPDGDPGGSDDGFPGSLMGTGHNWYQLVSEVSIPAPVISDAVAGLPAAETLQPFADVRGGLFEFESFEIPRVGLEYFEGRLHFTWGQHFEEEGPEFTHGWATPDLSSVESHGPWRIAGAPRYATNDYLFGVDPAWSAAHLPAGSYLATGRFRDGGWSGMGPSLYLYRPPEDEPPRTALASWQVLQYDTSYLGVGETLDGYHHSDEWTGGAWLTAGDRSAVVFVGTKGLGECWYGFENGVVWPDEGPYPPVPPPPYDQRGWWSSAFEAQLLFYDPAELAAVAAGSLAPHRPQPYATLSIDHTLMADRTPTTKYRTGAVAYDRENGVLYILEPHADDHQPIVHVWAVGTPG